MDAVWKLVPEVGSLLKLSLWVFRLASGNGTFCASLQSVAENPPASTLLYCSSVLVHGPTDVSGGGEHSYLRLFRCHQALWTAVSPCKAICGFGVDRTEAERLLEGKPEVFAPFAFMNVCPCCRHRVFGIASSDISLVLKHSKRAWQTCSIGGT